MGTDLLYLDTARLGRMSAGAQQANHDLTMLAGAEGASFLFERFLCKGAGNWPGPLCSRYPGLACWQGIGLLKQSLRLLAGSRPDLPVLLASRSAQLMKLAARLFCHPCRNILVTDLGWPGYHDILRAECRRANRSVTEVAVCQALLRSRLTEDEVVAFLRDAFVRHDCDGLFLTAVSNLGIRLPVERIVRAVESAREVRFVVIDGAQDFCHAPSDLKNEYCDLYLAGCHKWLGAYHPLGLGFYGQLRSRSFIEGILAGLLRSGEVDDPLLRFSGRLEGDTHEGLTETVNLTPLFSCQGAVSDAQTGAGGPTGLLPCRLRNFSTAADLAAASGWRPLLPQPAFQTGILVLEPERGAVRQVSAETLRSDFYTRGIALTAYEQGRIRLSMPEMDWQAGELEQLRRALGSLA